MRFYPTLVSSFLFVSAVVAHPLQHGPLTSVTDSSSEAGAALSRSAGTFQSVSSSFAIPPASGDAGSGAIILTSIDGAKCGGASLQTGIVILINEDGSTSYQPFSRWFPGDQHTYDSMTISDGHSIELSVNATSMTTGNITILNNSNGQSITDTLSSAHELCLEDARWVLQASGDGSNYKRLTNFGEFTFQDATAIGSDGQTYAPEDNAAVSDIVQDGTPVTSTEVEGSFITIYYK